MSLAVLALAISLTLATGIGAPLALAQDERDWVAMDTDGHMVMRYVGASELTREQREEVTNMSLSTMVHDRLRVDRLFDGEPPDPAWSRVWTATLTRFVRESLPEIGAMTVECRSRSCRLAMAHEGGTRLDEHRALMDTFEPRIKAFLARHPGSFEPVFLMVAGYQAPEPAYIKVFLQRMQKR
ncbi:MAG TPA: hypothetical protein VHH11_14730 [Gammaproteobacteria bacterium]|nr:hypothetical protein [Gammaproteobacteria bacterium]